MANEKSKCKVMTTFRLVSVYANYQFLVIMVLLEFNGLATWLLLLHKVMYSSLMCDLCNGQLAVCIASYSGCCVSSVLLCLSN